MTTVLLIVQDAPYGSERPFNALRLAAALQKADPPAHVRLSLLSDAVTLALRDQLRPDGQYNLETMLREFLDAGGEAKACSVCVDHRGLFRLKLVEGVTIGSMSELANWVLTSDRVIAF